MSSFRVLDKKSRLKLGIIVVIIIHIGMFYGFWRVHAKQIGNKVYEMDIYAAKAAEGLAFYEALPTEECVNVLNEQAPRQGIKLKVPQDEQSQAVDATKADEAKEKSAPPVDLAAITKEGSMETPLHYATSPRCKGVVSAPVGAEKLGADGFVGLELNIDTNGSIKHGEVSRSSGFAELDEAALTQVKNNLTFKPCEKDGATVGCKQYIKYRWKLQN